jgi:hypothetical protein
MHGTTVAGGRFIFHKFLPIRYPAGQKYTGLRKLCGMMKEMIAELRAITGICDYALFQHKRFKNKH